MGLGGTEEGEHVRDDCPASSAAEGAVPALLRGIRCGSGHVLPRERRAAILANGLLGVVAVLIGLTLLTNLRGAAAALAEATKSYRPMGVDYSRSILTSPWFTRALGAALLVVGVVFVTQAVVRL